jgi:hypothetical protein
MPDIENKQAENSEEKEVNEIISQEQTVENAESETPKAESLSADEAGIENTLIASAC